MTFKDAVEATAHVLEALGVVVITVTTVLALAVFVVDLVRRADVAVTYRAVRRRLGRGILLGLEVLLGADIVRSAAVEPTFRSVGVLAGIVLIRTFLSTVLEVELSGNWPWRLDRDEGGRRPPR